MSCPAVLLKSLVLTPAKMLRLRYAVSGTELRYAASRRDQRLHCRAPRTERLPTGGGGSVPYHPMHSLCCVRYRRRRSCYALSPVLPRVFLLRTCHPVSGTDLDYPSLRPLRDVRY
eukprot:1671967-Rhodomonas_salina.1